MPASVQIADDDVHNHPGINTIPDDDVHNHPDDDSDPTPIVNTSDLNSVNAAPIDLSNVPEYEREVAQSAVLDKGNTPETTAHVGVLSPSNVTVDDPGSFTTAAQAHELQHVIQYRNTPVSGIVHDALNPQAVSLAQSAPTRAGGEGNYEYGGTEGLEKLLKSGKTVADLNFEQQASIPQNYMKEYNKAVKAGDTKAIDHLNEVYGPAIKQLRNMANPSKTTINTTPEAPGPPPAELTREAVPVKGMYSKSTTSAHIPTQAAPRSALKKPSWSAAASALGRR